MTIEQAISYDPATDGMTDPAFVAKWTDAQIADLVASGIDRNTAASMTYAILDGMED